MPLRRATSRVASLGSTELVVICASTPWEGHQLLDQHIARALAAYAPVLYVEPPVSHLSRFRRGSAPRPYGRKSLTEVTDGVWIMTPLAPPLKERPVVKAISLWLTRRAMRLAVTDLGAHTVRAVIITSLNPLFRVFGEQYRVFYCKDDYVAGAKLMRIKESRLRRAEARQPRMANIIVAVSQVLVERFERMGYNAHLIPNGCDADAFRVTADPRGRVIDIPHPVAAMVGQLSDRVDLAYLEAVADRGLSLLLIGPRHPVGDEARLDALLARPNVYWVGPKPFAQLPSYLRVADVCLLPYADSAFNQASFPLKVLEYLAAGQGVVATDVPAVRWLETDLVTVASTPTSFADSAREIATHAPDTGLRARRAEFAAQHSWTARGTALAGLLGLHEATSSGGVPRHTTTAREDLEQR